MLTKRAFFHHCAFCAASLYGVDALAREGVEVGKPSTFAKLVPASEVEGQRLQPIQPDVEAGLGQKRTGTG